MKSHSFDRRILALVARPEGASRQQIISGMCQQSERREVAERFDALLAGGQMHLFTRPAFGGRGQHAKQYFASAEDGRRWAASTPQRRQKLNPTGGKRGGHRPQPRAEQAMTVSDARRREGVRLPSGQVKRTSLSADAPAVVPPGVKVQRLGGMPAFDPRYQVDPGTRVVGGFASMGVGRYLDTTK